MRNLIHGIAKMHLSKWFIRSSIASWAERAVGTQGREDVGFWL